MENPLKQFAIERLIPLKILGYDISFTNSSLAMCLVFILLVFFFSIVSRKINIIPAKLQIIAEELYNLIHDMVITSCGTEAKKYIPFIFTLFIFILSCNLFGMLPYSFTITSHISITFALAAFVFIAITMIGFIRHGLKYLSLFLPAGTPIFMAPLMICAEFFAYMVRPISLSLRLAGNMVAGHIVMKVIGAFVIMAGIGGVFPFFLLILLTGFEIFVSILQAYIFTILTCVYLSDAIKLH